MSCHTIGAKNSKRLKGLGMYCFQANGSEKRQRFKLGFSTKWLSKNLGMFRILTQIKAKSIFKQMPITIHILLYQENKYML